MQIDVKRVLMLWGAMFDLRIAKDIRQCSRLCVRVLRCELSVDI